MKSRVRNRCRSYGSLLSLLLLLSGCAKPAAPEVTEPFSQMEIVETTAPELTLAAETEPPETIPEETAPASRRYTLTFLGDCTFGGTPETYYAQVGFAGLMGQDYRYPFVNVISYLENDDFTIANLEGTLTEVGSPQNPKYSFRGDPEFVNVLTENSIEAVTLANNHSMDYGKKGFDATRQTLEAAGVPYVLPNDSTVVTLADGTTIGVYATTYASADAAAMEEGIRALKQQGVDIIVYAPHWGVENSYGITPEQERLAHIAIDAGANIVYGSHPHVLEPIVEYGDGVIFYSLANFAFGGNGGPQDMDTVLIQQEVVIDPDGIVTLGRRTLVPCRVSAIPQYNNFQPTPYEVGSEAYDRVLRKLAGAY